MVLGVHHYITAAWIVIGVIWLLGAMTAKPIEQTESRKSQVGHMTFFVLAFVFLFNSNMGVGPLSHRFIPYTLTGAYLGLVLTIIGIAFAIWARLRLGRNWSATVAIKSGHTFIRSGPYSLARHPIYTDGMRRPVSRRDAVRSQ